MSALDGIRILDLTRLAPGPFCTMILGDLGAEVTRIEEPGLPTGRRAWQAGTAGVRMPGRGFASSPYNALNRNKKSVGLDLKSGPGREVYMRLAQRADVVVEEFRPGVAKRLGIDYETLAARNPRLIYCAITGYGQSGPYRDLVGHDINYIATAGALSIMGPADGKPAIPHNLLADYAGGGMHAVIGVLAALVARHSSGQGQYIDVAMLDGTMALLAQTFSSFFAGGRLPARGATRLDGGVPNYDRYETADGKYITIAALEPWFFANLCRVLGREDLIEHEFDPEKSGEIRRALTEAFKSKSRDEWFEILKQSDICVGRLLTLDEVAEDPQVKARGMIVELDSHRGERIRQVGVSLKLSATPGSIRSLAPSLGEHTGEILESLGYSRETIERWQAQGTVR